MVRLEHQYQKNKNSKALSFQYFVWNLKHDMSKETLVKKTLIFHMLKAFLTFCLSMIKENN